MKFTDHSGAQALRRALLSVACILFVSSPAAAIEFTTDTTILSSDYVGEDLVVTGCTLTIDCGPGRGSYRSLWVRNNGRVTHPPGSANGLWLQISDNVTVDGWCTIDVSGKGSPAGVGPGCGVSGTGGAHGGNGQGNAADVYDSITDPADQGSGGGDNGANPGGAGGGSIRLEIGGTLTLNSHVYADGSAATLAGGGAGGTVQIVCGVMAGGGSIHARGGDADVTGLLVTEAAGGGGGGRVSVVAGTSSWTGGVAIYGGNGKCWGVSNSGGPGTYYSEIGADRPVLVFNNAGRPGETRQPALDVPGMAMEVYGTRGMVIDCTLLPLSVYSLRVAENSTLSHPSGSAAGLHIVTAQNLQLDGWCYLDVSGRGHPEGTGPGAGGGGTGGAHGGGGQANGASVYGSITAPADLGSGGGANGANPGAPGGGRIHLEVGGTLTLNSHVYADGGHATLAGSGSGGSVLVTCVALAGSGSVHARGGNCDVTGLPADQAAGGGGGGRVTITAGSSTWSGTAWAYGGTGTCWGSAGSGGPGTFYRQIGTDPPVLLFHNDGRAGTTVQAALNMPDTLMEVRGARGMVVDCSAQPLSVYSLLVANNSTVSHPAGSVAGLHVVTVENLQIDGWCYLDVSGKGHPEGGGPGAGVTGSGGAYGGSGQGNGAPVYGSITAPSDLGSGGGANGGQPGAAGGGRIRLDVGGTLVLNSHLYADGAPATLAGSGSGGSVAVTCGALAGTGSVHARGGDSGHQGLPDDAVAGGGGGGRVSIIAGASTWSGGAAVHGGAGKAYGVVVSGGPGTFYRKLGADPPVLLFHNEGRGGTTLQPALNMPDTVMEVRGTRGMVIDCAVQPLSVYSLLLANNSTVSHPAGSTAGLDIVTVGNMQVDGWCYLDVSGKGHPEGSGAGAGVSGTGGTHGGSGQGNGAAVYDSIVAPAGLGSGGGASDLSPGGAGGGLVRLVVNGTLTLNGTIEANGGSAVGAGAGSGGSVHVTCAAMAGTASISARGGSSDASGLPGDKAAGGGGGGRVAVLAGSSSWSGTAWATGGTGTCWGAAGSGGPGTYYRRLGSDSPVLVFHNEGRAGVTVHPALDMPDTVMEIHGSRGMVIDCSARALSVYSLKVANNSTLSHPSGSEAGLRIVTAGDLQVDGWCYLDATGRGYPEGSGPGAGNTGSGGAYGGNGGNGNNATYGSMQHPQDLGSGGGALGANSGTAGGGRISLFVGGVLTVGGQVLVDGNAAAGAGGGSGGSILVVAGNVQGGGVLLARGGSSSGGGGGGGGGRIAAFVPPGASPLPGGGANVAGGSGGSPAATAGTIYTGVPADLTFDGPAAFQWQADGRGRASVRVVNTGDMDVPSFDVAMYDRDPSLGGAVIIDSVTVPGLAALGGIDVELTAHVPPELAEVWIMVDSGHAVPEMQEANNVTSVAVPARTATKTLPTDRTGTITELVTLRGYCYRKADNAPLSGKTIEFRVDGSLLGTAITGSGGRADYNWIIGDGPASRTIGAQFVGDVDYAPSSGTATLTCQSWTTKMVVFNRTARITDRTELKARLLRSDNAPLYGKTIAFYIDGTFIINRNTNTDGYASHPNYDVPDGAGAGNRTIRADWAGNGGYAAVSREATLTVLKAIPYIWVLSKSVPQGGIANLYSYFRRLYDYKKMENKPVTFKIDGTWIADVNTGTVASGEPGVARYLHNTTGLGLGPHTVRCEFAGDSWLDAGFGEGNLNII